MRRRVSAAEMADPFRSIPDVWGRVSSRILGVLDSDKILLASFDQQIGQRLTVETVTGKRDITIRAVEGTTIQVTIHRLGGTTIDGRIRVRDLSPAERFKRVGTVEGERRHLLQGMAAMNAGAYDSAVTCFSQTTCPLATALMTHATKLAAAALQE